MTNFINTPKANTLSDLPTPSFVVDLDILEQNIHNTQNSCNQNGCELWPMIKTHKSTDIAHMQQAAGATGFLVGTVDAADLLCQEGMENLILAYPICGSANIDRILEISKRTRLILSLDNYSSAQALDTALEATGQSMEYLLIIDSGLHRFGVSPEKAPDLAERIATLNNLKLIGISTHPGHVYSAKSDEDIIQAVTEESRMLRTAADELRKSGFILSVIASGSTPTFRYSVTDPLITQQRPGNYVFHDNLQIALGTVTEAECAMTVMATVISDAQEGRLVLDAGSKCLGLDIGGHGIPMVNGYGRICGHPELTIKSLSEEVAIVSIEAPTDLKVGDRVQIIPNHTCSSANMTDYLIGYRGQTLERVLMTDIRSGSRKPPLLNLK